MPGLKLDTGVKDKKASALPSVDDFFGAAPALTSEGKEVEDAARVRDQDALQQAGPRRYGRDKGDAGGKKKRGREERGGEGEGAAAEKKKAKQAAGGDGDEEGGGARKKGKKKSDKKAAAGKEGEGGGAAVSDGEGDDGSGSDDDGEDKSERTIFVGSIPHKMTKKQLKALFKDCGDIESVRLRSIPIDSPGLPKKTSIAMGKISTTRETCNAYVVFADKDSVQAALKLNGTQVRGHHIRVDMAEGKKKDFNPRMSVFVGNLSFSAEEEAVRRFFAQCGKVEGVRLIRDKETSMGKGFGYVAYADVDGVQAAVKMHGQKFQGRELRVFRAAKREKAARMDKERKERAAAKGLKKSPQAQAGKPSPHKPAEPKASGGARRLEEKKGSREKAHQGFKANAKSVPKFKTKDKGVKGKLGKKKAKTAERMKKQRTQAKKLQKMVKKSRSQT